MFHFCSLNKLGLVLLSWLKWLCMLREFSSLISVSYLPLIFPYVCVHAESLQWRLTLCNPMDCSLPGSSVHGILQARILEWVAMLFSLLLAILLAGSRVGPTSRALLSVTTFNTVRPKKNTITVSTSRVT